METATIMHDCLVKLLNNNDEDSFECLCSLLTTMGKVLDLAEAKPLMDHCFNEIEKIVREEKTSSQIRVMLQDIIDLRLNNWVSTGPDQGPDNIDLNHKVAKIEEQEEPKQLFSRESETQPDPSEQRDQGIQREEPWITAPKRKNSRATDPNKSPTLSKLINPGAPRPQPREIIVSLSVKEDVQMRTSKNALKPGRNRESLPAEPKSQGTQDLLKKVRSILDKRTPRKFIQLMNKVKALTIDTEERLKGIVNLVFEKAIDEPSLSVAYGNMCCCLAELEVPITDEPQNTVSFMKLLQGRCQKEFNKDKEDDVVIRAKQQELDSAPRRDRHRLLIELQEAKDIIRRRSIGYIKFIGELFKLKKLKAPVMHDCVVKLLKNRDNVSLECLCSLLTIIGEDFDLEEAKPRINHYFLWIKKIVREGKTATRIRVMLQDIIDLRLHNWGSTGPDQCPDNIDPSHKVAKIEEQEEPTQVKNQLLSKEIKRQPDPSEQKDQGVKRDEPWITVPKRKNSRATDPNKSPTLSKLINPGALRPQPREIIVSLSVKEDVQMRTSKNALKPGRNRESLPAEPKSQGTQDLLKKVRSILDKRTPRKFIQLMNKVKALTIDTEERLKGIVNLVFEKAIDEPSLSVAYGNMCCCLAELEVPITDEPQNTVSFMKLLQGRCQKEFNKDKEDDVVIRAKQQELDSAPRRDRHRLLIELQEAKDIIRRRSIGYIKFIGELFKLKKLKAPVMHDCVIKLLKNRDNVSLECLCSLLTIIGEDFDLEEAKPRINHYFLWIQKIVREGKTATRIRVMLQDIIDLRLHNWGSTGPDQCPDNIDPSHKVAKIEEQEEPTQVKNQLLSKEIKRQPDPSEQRDQGVKRDEPWITVPKRKNSRATDPNKSPTLSKQLKHQVDEHQANLWSRRPSTVKRYAAWRASQRRYMPSDAPSPWEPGSRVWAPREMEATRTSPTSRWSQKGLSMVSVSIDEEGSHSCSSEEETSNSSPEALPPSVFSSSSHPSTSASTPLDTPSPSPLDTPKPLPPLLHVHLVLSPLLLVLSREPEVSEPQQLS